MASVQTSYELNPQQLDAALAALAKAQDSFSLSPRQKRFHRALGIYARVTSVAFIMCVLSLAIGIFTGYVVSEPDSPVASLGCLIGGAALLIGILTGAAATLRLIFNVGIVLTLLRQSRLLKRLGLQHVSYSAWKRKRGFLTKIGGAAHTTIGAVLVSLGIATIAFAVIAWFDEASARATWVPVMVVTGGSFVLFGLTILTWHSIQRTQERLALVADANKLRAMLSSLESGPESGVVVPAAILERVAVIEHAQIARERARAVLAGVSSANRGYAVEISRGAAETKAALPPDLRLDVEELLEELAAGSQPAAAQGNHGDGLLSVRTPDGSAEVGYTVDNGNRRIHIVEVRDCHVH